MRQMREVLRFQDTNYFTIQTVPYVRVSAQLIGWHIPFPGSNTDIYMHKYTKNIYINPAPKYTVSIIIYTQIDLVNTNKCLT